MKKLITALTLALALAASHTALAHESPARHGGIVKSAGDLSFELVNKDGKTAIYVDDHGKGLAMAGGSGTLTVLKGTEKTVATLSAGGANTLVAKDGIRLEAGAKVVASIVLPDKTTVSVRFAVK